MSRVWCSSLALRLPSLVMPVLKASILPLSYLKKNQSKMMIKKRGKPILGDCSAVAPFRLSMVTMFNNHEDPDQLLQTMAFL